MRVGEELKTFHVIKIMFNIRSKILGMKKSYITERLFQRKVTTEAKTLGRRMDETHNRDFLEMEYLRCDHDGYIAE